jgi:hypothetical protein
MDERYHLIRDLVQNNTNHVQYKPTELTVADILTTPSDYKIFTKPQPELLGHLV